jgi:sigma-B regulation protein RsbU (phosphoserine phosphatase)
VTTVTKKIPAYLKLHSEETFATDEPRRQPFPGLDALCRSFERATGWSLRYEGTGANDLSATWSAPVDAGNGAQAGQLVLHGAARTAARTTARGVETQSIAGLDLDQVRPLALELSNLLGQLQRTRHALWQREAELAAGVPITAHANEAAHLAERLEGVLRGGAEAVGAQAAALYLLDDATSQLKLRSAWGLPKDRLLEPARPLRGAVADLEALMGHAVVLEDAAMLPHWKTPENFASAVCVPVSTPTIPLGTLWVFCDRVRDFSSEQTNLVEIIAGRLASDLEREMLLQEGVQSKQIERQLQRAAGWQQDRLPSIMPLLDDWQLAGWTSQARGIGGDFYDWCVVPDGALAVAVGDAHGALLEAGLSAASLHTAIKSHELYRHDAGQMLSRLNETLWTASPGDQFASLFYARIDPDSAALEYASAGRVGVIILRADQFEILPAESAPLGTDPDSTFARHQQQLGPGDVLVVVSEGVLGSCLDASQPITEATLANALQPHRHATAEQLVERVRSLLTSHASQPPADDCTVLIVKRR